MKIAVVDDDIQMYERLNSYFNELLGKTFEVSYFQSGEEFLSAYEKGMFDFVILDIFMDGINGMEVAREIRKTDRSIRIAFSTTSNEFASESYEVNACYYLHKPLERERVKAMLDRLNIAEIEEMRTANLPDGTSIILRDIIYADFSSHCVTFHCKKSGDITVRTPFSEIEPLLCAYSYFFCPYKGIIVNFYEVSAQTDDTFKMSNGNIIPISRRKAKDVLDKYSSFRFEQLRKGENT